MLVDHVGPVLIAAVPGCFEQLKAGQHNSRLSHERFEQREALGGELNRLLATPHAPRRRVQAQIADLEQRRALDRFAADVRNAAEMDGVAAKVHERWGRVDVLIANAGISSTTAGENLSAVDASDVISINVVGVVNSVAAVLPDMLKRGSGHLVAISSLAALRGMPKSGVYSASKAAVSTFFESMRVDLRGSGVDVTVIHPGFIRTPMTAGRKKKLPFLLEADDAACRILRAVERRARTYAFPWLLAAAVRLIRHMPSALYDRFASNTSFRD